MEVLEEYEASKQMKELQATLASASSQIQVNQAMPLLVVVKITSLTGVVTGANENC